MVLVSHDRHLLRAVTDQFLLVDEGKVKPFNDDLDAYRNWLLQSKTIADEPNNLDQEQAKSSNKKAQRQQLADQRKLLNPLKKEVSALEKKMHQAEAEIKTIEAELAQPEMYQPENRERMEQLSVQRGELNTRLEETEEKWLIKSEEYEQLAGL
jgi:ATP-binding cassette subfamily F protein 3